MSRSTVISQEKHQQTEDDSRTKTKRKRKSSAKVQDEPEKKETDDRDESIDAADQSSVSAAQINAELPKKEKKKKKKKAAEIIAREEAAEECTSTIIPNKSKCDEDNEDDNDDDGKPEERNPAQKSETKLGNQTREAVTSSRKVESIFTTATRSKHGVWVGNLLFTTTAQELARFFEPAGKVTRLNMPAGKRAHEANSGFAYVDFDSAEAVDAALEKSECLLGGRKLLIKRSSDYSGRPSAIPASSTTPSSNSTTPSASIPPPTVSKSVRKILDRQKQPPAPCIYFGNLGFETTSEGIVSMLHAHHQAQQVWKPKKNTIKMNGKDQEEEEEDEEEEEEEEEEGRGRAKPDTRSAQVGIRKVRMGTFEDTGKCKGFAFVDFETIDQATNVLVNLKNHRLDGRNLTVEYASVEAVKRGGGSVRSMHQQQQSKRGYLGSAGPTGRPDRFQRDEAPHLARRPPPSIEPRPRTHPNNPSSTRSHQPTAPFAPPPIIAPPPAAEEPVRKVKKEFKGRQKPGAALANAQRAPTGIVKNPETVGKKIVFS
ncbi:uncharacterized protein PGTG_22688 [Puccinia graminis f. sp. tritici CRL 75-36-700-3]|uniref:RRM domain-containing protein n=1 Tax=Puccinia graminis f. sp. tritici (strain CRL 75-36-700-3 / race SCCL) TaxID=418459 RepID=H6QVA5_PUCGT|nr:uncharacterized protein PGTG_22688 [Puccinia graminis f. sp. tritici CRL 75-36-700-3]EHS62806.1 hypothetical protein PGTG_22688 [Puccinia graminis f. sp. tritici CRL 75-36-700-3]